MPNFVSQLKQEIARIGRREAKQAQGRTQKGVVELRKAVASIRKAMAAMTKEVAELKRLASKTAAAIPPPPAVAEEERGWMMGKGIRALRRRMKLSQSLFARLIGVSDQSVYIWERKSGKIAFRKNTWAEIQKVRDLGAREVRRILEEQGVDVKGKKRGRKPGVAPKAPKPSKTQKSPKAPKNPKVSKPARAKKAPGRKAKRAVKSGAGKATVE